MKSRIPLLALFIPCLAATVFGQQAQIQGYVSNNRGQRVASVRIVTVPGGHAGTTDSRGHFIISLPDNIEPGQAARIQVKGANWVIFNPMFGNCVTQSAERNYEPLRVVIAPKGSPLALSPKRLSQVIEQWAAERAKLRVDVGNLRQELDEYAFLRQYAKEYGFTLEQFRDAVERWAQIKDSDDKEERALKEYWQKNYGKAAQLAQESAQLADEELKQANKKTNEASFKVIRRYKLAGNSYYAQYKFREAVDAYGSIDKYFDNKAISRDNFIAEWAEIKLLLGNAKEALGVRVKGEESLRLIKSALAEYEQSLVFYTREQFPQDWGALTTNSGNALRELGVLVDGPESIKYLNSAVVAHRAALAVFTFEQSPQRWAVVQINLGNVLLNLGERANRAEGITYFEDALAAYRSALTVLTYETSPQEWASAQTGLGIALLGLGERSSGDQSIKYLNDAADAHRAALKIRTVEQSPQEWAASQNNLGVVLWNLAFRVSSSARTQYLKDAIAVYNAALTVRTPEHLPLDWAATQTNLGNALLNLGELTVGEESIQYSKNAAAAHRAALQVYTRKDSSQRWAIAQNNLGNALLHLGRRAGGAEGTKYLNEATVAYREALQVMTSEHSPQWWTRIQNNLARAYYQLHNWSSAVEEYAKILMVDPDNKQAYEGAALLYHDKLFDFDKAFTLNQQWQARHRDDVSAQAEFAQAHFTVGRFVECKDRINVLLAVPEVPASTKTALRAIEIASLLADNKADQVPARIDALITEVQRQPPEFRVRWILDGARHFIDQNEKLAPHRAWLGQLFDALASKDRDTMLQALQNIRTKFKN